MRHLLLQTIILFHHLLIPPLAAQSPNFRLIPTESRYLVEGFDLIWDVPEGVDDEPQTSDDLKTWKRLVREFPTTAPLNTGIEIPLEEARRYFRLMRWPVGDETPPAGVSNLSTSTAGGVSTLTWTDSTDADVALYEVIPEGSDGAFYTVPPGTEHFTLENGVESATVRAVDSSGNRSGGLLVAPFDDSSAFAGYQLIISPTEMGLGRDGELTIVAEVRPVPDGSLLFGWGTNPRLGTLDDVVPHPNIPVKVEKLSSTGASSVLFKVLEESNPGGRTTVKVGIYDPDSEPPRMPLAEATAYLEIEPPKPQTPTFQSARFDTEGDIEDRLDAHFYTAWVFTETPGYDTYVFTMLRTFEGTTDRVGDEFEYTSNIYDRQGIIDRFGSDIFGLQDGYLAFVGGNRIAKNYDPGDAWWTELIENIVAHRLNQAQAVWSVRPLVMRRDR